MPERLGGRGSYLLFSSREPWLGGWGACSRQRAGGAGGVAEQKPGLAASTPLWESGLVPRDEGTSGEVGRTSVLGTDIDQVGLKLTKEVEGESAPLPRSWLDAGYRAGGGEGSGGTQVQRSSQEIVIADCHSRDGNSNAWLLTVHHALSILIILIVIITNI